MFEASAPAKVILFGEHAVVYNQPAIAVPVSSLRAVASARLSGSGITIEAPDLNTLLPVDLDTQIVDNALALTVKLTLNRLEYTAPNLHITLHSQIPMASGLGSGAAVSTALARVLSIALGRPLDNATINEIVYEVEKIHHGTPSGIDNTVIAYEQPVYFVRGQPIQTFSIGAPLLFLIADTGKSALTRIAVGDVRKLFEANPAKIQPILDSIGKLVNEARICIENGQPDRVGELMLQNHTLLQKLTVSSPELDTLVNAAINAGALGAKLSGGGRGGNMIALVTPETSEEVKAALFHTGAVHVFETTVA